MCSQKPIQGDVNIAVMVVPALVGDGVPFDMPVVELIVLFAIDLSGDFTLFGV